MKQEEARRILKSYNRILKNRGIEFTKIGSGRYMYMRIDAAFETATIHCYTTLERLLTNYTLMLSSDCHVEIDLTYLELAGWKRVEENVIGVGATRLTICRDVVDDDFDPTQVGVWSEKEKAFCFIR